MTESLDTILFFSSFFLLFSGLGGGESAGGGGGLKYTTYVTRQDPLRCQRSKGSSAVSKIKVKKKNHTKNLPDVVWDF